MLRQIFPVRVRLVFSFKEHEYWWRERLHKSFPECFEVISMFRHFEDREQPSLEINLKRDESVKQIN